MTAIVRWGVGALVLVHGLIHLMGAAKGLGWADVTALEEPISSVGGAAWLVVSLVVVAAAAGIVSGRPSWWWALAAGAAVLSQALVVSAWSDAKWGTVPNVILVVAAVVGFASTGPPSLRARWQARAESALLSTPAVTDRLRAEDLRSLPAPLAAYVRRSGAVGQPRVQSFFAEFHGRIRGGPHEPWMSFTAEQVSTYGETPRRLLLMHARRSGVPIVLTHLYDEAGATMRGKAMSLVTVVDGRGPELDRAETVTVLNDLVVMAPGAIPFAPVQWAAVDRHTVSGTFTAGSQRVSATLVFDDEGRLMDFVSDDRLRASADGRSFTRMRWTTPISRYGQVRGRPMPVSAQALWHAPEPEGPFAYLEVEIDDIVDNPVPGPFGHPRHRGKAGASVTRPGRDIAAVPG